MSGYCEDFSMSRNARDAYKGGEMPLSKWTKTAMLEAARELDQEGDKMPVLQKLTTSALRVLLLENSSWHHTSSRYNITNFWRVDEDLFTWEPAAFAKAVEAAVERVKTEKEESAGETPQKAASAGSHGQELGSTRKPLSTSWNAPWSQYAGSSTTSKTKREMT